MHYKKLKDENTRAFSSGSQYLSQYNKSANALKLALDAQAANAAQAFRVRLDAAVGSKGAGKGGGEKPGKQ
jgi:hypothetical protein